MKRKQLLLFLFCFIFSLNIQAQKDITRLVEKLLASTPIEEDLQELCDDIGGRVTGSEANEQAVEWAYNKLRVAGLRVRKEAFNMPVLWLPKSTSVEVSGALNFKPSAVAKYQAIPNIYKGEIVYVGMGKATDFDALGEKIRGKFALVETDLCLDINGLFAEYAAATATEVAALKYGAKGIIFMASRPSGLLYRFITSKTTDAGQIPQLVMAREDAKRCIRTLQKGGKLQLEASIQAQVGGEFESHNVIAEIKGSEKPEEVVVVGAHLDSWALGTGANDNGCNVSMLIDIARQMHALNIRPKRTIRFALWNGEEQGYFGSWDYTKRYLADMDKHIMAMSVDIGSGDIIGFFTNGQAKLIPALDKVLQPVEKLGEFNHVNVPIVGTDNFDFMLQGVGNLVASHKPQVYGLNYHASSDTYDKVDLKSLKNNSAIVAAVVLGFANLEAQDITWERMSRAEIDALFEETKLEYTMRMFNVWEAWVDGMRGQKK